MVVVHDVFGAVLLLVKIDGTKFQEILAQNLVASARRLKLGTFVKITTPNMHQNTHREHKIKFYNGLLSFSRSEPY